MESEKARLAVPFAWQREQWGRLCQQHADNRLPHALLLAGPKGVGKLHLASAFGCYLLCLSPLNNAACGHCKGCDLNLSGTHPDLLLLRPEDGSRVIKIDQVRSLTEFLSKTAQQGGRKVAVIEPAEGLNANSANALLKSLEEPSGDTTLLLVSHLTSGVLATIRSRCQLLPFAIPSTDDSLAWLTPLAVGQDPEYLLKCAAGAPLAAFALLDGDKLVKQEALIKGLLGVATHNASPLALAAELASGEPLEVIESMQQWLQSGFRQQASGGEASAGRDAQLVNLLAATPATVAYRFWDKLVRLKRQSLSAANPNKQLLLEELMLDWQALARQSRYA
ncbi:MAG: DNA polymerase III subunit delta' [Gammaproteobacteria bacterium]|nr:DNA polymerase III subunit delta' [Gammaproteobacteria bacterium]